LGQTGERGGGVDHGPIQGRKERERGEERKEGEFPLLFVSWSNSKREREKKEKGAGIKERGSCHGHVPSFGNKCMSTSVEEKIRERSGGDVVGVTLN
jgi:hypothetical protein